MILNQRLQQVPQNLMSQLENNLKRRNPQAFKKYQEARKNNNPNDLLNETINGFSPQQRQQWDSMMKGINSK
jgi:hypothetical protein